MVPESLDAKKISAAVHLYGVLGVIPFFVGAVGPWITPQYTAFLTEAFQIYAAVIISFLAGSIWTVALLTRITGQQLHLAIAMVVVILAWASLFLAGFSTVPIHAVCLLFLCWWEKRTNLSDTLDAEYLCLRGRLTWPVVACHMIVELNLVRAAQLI